MLWIWRFLIGYLSIKISGENCEEAINIMARNGVKIENLYYKKGGIVGYISIKNYFKLFYIRHKINCKFKIIKKYGLIFYIKKQKKRIGFISGIIIFFAILVILSNYIWIINIEGNDTIPSSEILNLCKNLGIHEGVAKSKINNKYDSQKLQLMNEKIAWCSLNTEGCVLTVNLSETVISNETDKTAPSNLKAKTDGKIKKIDVTSGDVLIKVGDIVAKGDLLVSGIQKTKNTTLIINSFGTITAETERVFSAQCDITRLETIETGDNLTRYTVSFFGVKIPLFIGKINRTCNYKQKITNLKFLNKNIPIKIAAEKYKPIKNIKKTYTDDEILEKLNTDIETQVKNYKFISCIEKDREIIRNKKSVLLKITYICEENIAFEDKILLSKEN